MKYFFTLACALFFRASFPAQTVQIHATGWAVPVNSRFVGTWKIYTVDANETLHFSHNEKYTADYGFTQWNASFSVTGIWWNNGRELCVKFDADGQTDCGNTEFEDENTFYYLEHGQRHGILVYKRQLPVSRPTPATPPAAPASKPAPTTRTTTSAKPPSPGYEEYIERVDCTSCYASGYKKCMFCYGGGKLSRTVTKYEYDRTVEVSEKYDCPTCNGQGKQRCGICNGQGYIEHKGYRPKKN